MNSLVWLIWAACGGTLAITARHPLYALLLLAIAAVAGEIAAVERRSAWWWRLLALPAAGGLFNALFARTGDSVLFVVPAAVPVLSGTVTLEAFAYGAMSGLAFAVLLAWLWVFAAHARAADLVRLAPRSFQAVALVVTMALGLAPATRRRLGEIRAAQAARGHRPRGVRDWLPLWVPLLVTGVEQSSQLAEAMIARGYAAEPRTLRKRDLGLVTGGLALATAGGLMRFASEGPVGMLALGGGVALFLLGLWLTGRSSARTRYREAQMAPAETVVALVLIAATGVLLAAGGGEWAWDPYPSLALPGFNLALGGGLLVFLLPPILARARMRNSGAT